MARFNVADADKYGGQGGAGYFSLKDDGDVAKVRFLGNSIEDFQGYAVHQVELDGKKRWVNCLREYGQPKDTCPLCARGDFQNVKYFIPLYNIDEEKSQIWERGKQFGGQLTSLCSRYPNLVTHRFEIERRGKKGDTGTTYTPYEIGVDAGVTLDDFEIADPLGTVVLDKTYEELREFVATGSFGAGDAPVRRRESTDTASSASTSGYRRRGEY